MKKQYLCVATAALALAACAGQDGPLRPGANDHKTLQEALLVAEPGAVIELGAGRFVLDATLSLDVEGVTLRGQGMDETILDFAGQAPGTGGEGVLVTANDFTVESLAVENTLGDGIKVEGTTGAAFRSVRVEWTNGPDTDNGAYGLYPVQVTNVLIEDSRVRGASDAGIYVGQSANVVVRRNEVWENVAGIEIENTTGADVYENRAHGNTGGLLVFSLPELPVKDGRDARIYDNEIADNNLPNFGKEGAIVSTIPAGSGVIVMASDNVELFGNRIHNNQNSNLAVISYLSTGRIYNDPGYDPYTEGVYIHDNEFVGGGESPNGAFADAFVELAGGSFPDIVWDGLTNPDKLVDGAVPDELRLYIENNGDADFVNLDLGSIFAGGQPNVTTDLGPFQGALPAVPQPVDLGVSTGAGSP